VTSGDATFRTLTASSPAVALPPAPQDEVVKTSVVVTGTKHDVAPYIKIFTVAGKPLKTFFAYSSFFRGGVNVAVGDVTGDGNDEIVTAPGPGGPPTVRIFDMNGRTLRKDFAAFPGLFRNGVNITLVDVDGDRKKEIVAAPMSGAPQLRVFGLRNGRFVLIMPSVFAFARTMQSGITLGGSDLDADGFQEVLATPGAGGPPLVRVFGIRNRILRQIMADALIGPATSRAGMSIVGATVATGVPGVASVSSDGSSLVRWFVRNGQGKLVRAAETFLAFHPDFQGGAALAGCDLNADGPAELLAAVAGGGNPLVRIFDTKGKMAFPEFYAFPKTMKDGLTIACGQK
ncbi:MAG: VCBS repeat-containing protein, partial [Candidatus Kerfeldbacteria bacterium]|nr:VCBS repeat-containing protein [Candidatus Kerfeldbacteria bacterium]